MPTQWFLATGMVERDQAGTFDVQSFSDRLHIVLCNLFDGQSGGKLR
jgi:hypothetical protein